MASYPSSIVAFATHNSGDTIQPADVNNPNAEIVAVETGLINGFQHNVKPLNDKGQDLGDSTHAWNNIWSKGTTQFNGVAYTWPAADGANGQFLSTNGSKTLSWANPVGDVQEFRLTLTTGLPVTTSDVTAATTLYFTPYTGNRVTVQDTSGNKTVLTSAEISIAVPATTSQMYDVWVFNSAGTLTLELLAWTNDMTRATGISRSNGQLTKTGDTSRLYVGSFRTTAVSGQTEDSVSNRFVWNFYNRVERPFQRFEATASWNYTTATIRQANGAAANQVNFIIGVSEDPVVCSVNVTVSQAAASGVMAVGIGLDSTTTFASNQALAQGFFVAASGGMIQAEYRGFPGIGKHSLMWNETAWASGTTTWYGASNGVGGGAPGATTSSGLLGFLRG